MIELLLNFETYLYSWIFLICSSKLIGNSRFSQMDSVGAFYIIILLSFALLPIITMPLIIVWELSYYIKEWAVKEDKSTQQTKSSSNIPFTHKDCEKLSNSKKLDKLIEHFKWTAFDNTSSSLKRMKEKLTEVEQKYPRIHSATYKIAEVALNYTITLTLDDALELYREGKPNRDALSSIVDVLNKANSSITDLTTSEIFRIEKEKKELADISMKQYNEVKESVFKTMEVFVSKKGE